MSALTAREVRAVSDLADALYDFLPGKPHPHADHRLSFPGAARVAGVSPFWSGGSKAPAIAQLLRFTLEQRRSAFCPLMVAIINNTLIYRRKKNPLTRQEMDRVNELVHAIGFKIPEHWDAAFLQSLAGSPGPGPTASPAQDKPTAAMLQELSVEFVGLEKVDPKLRGFAFERTLKELFYVFGLAPRSSFRLVGEQIDGSFDLSSATYLVEAKWTGPQIGVAELLVFAGKVQAKARWSRGLFISYAGYSEDGLAAFARGRATDIICMDGKDLWHVLSGDIGLRELIQLKARRAVETGRAFVPAHDLMANVR